MAPEILVAVLSAALVLFNLYASMRVVRDPFTERARKVAQTILIWLVPILGAVIILLIHRDERFEKREYQISSEDSFDGRPDHRLDHD